MGELPDYSQLKPISSAFLQITRIKHKQIFVVNAVHTLVRKPFLSQLQISSQVLVISWFPPSAMTDPARSHILIYSFLCSFAIMLLFCFLSQYRILFFLVVVMFKLLYPTVKIVYMRNFGCQSRPIKFSSTVQVCYLRPYSPPVLDHDRRCYSCSC